VKTIKHVRVTSIHIPAKFYYDSNEPNENTNRKLPSPNKIFSQSHRNFIFIFFTMQQRSSISNSRFSSDDHGTFNISVEQPQNAKRRRTADDDSLDTLPVYHRTTARRDVSRSRSPTVNKMIHAIPLLVFICLFTLWWFSFPGIVSSCASLISFSRSVFLLILS